MVCRPRPFFCSCLAVIALVLSAQAYAAEKTVPVIVSEVVEDSFVDRVEALGTLRANESVILTASVMETIRAVHFEDGARVEKGDVLVEMTSAEENAQLEEATSRAEEAERQYDRIKPLAKDGAAPLSLVDQRRREYETAKAQLDAIQSRLEDRLVVAPFDGVLGLRNVSVGALVNPGEQVTTLDDDSVMKLDFAVPAPYMAELRPGLKITATSRTFAGKVFVGEVSSIDSRVDPVTRSIVIRALLPNPERMLKPGLLMSVELIKNPRRTLVVPEEALIPLGQQQFVYVVEAKDGQSVALKREVKIGARRPGEAEVLEGLQAGEKVVVHGTQQVSTGKAVQVQAVLKKGQSIEELLEAQAKGAA